MRSIPRVRPGTAPATASGPRGTARGAPFGERQEGRAVARRLAVSVYLPWVFAQLGRGMLLPVVPLYLRDAGLSYSRVSEVLAAVGVGAVLGGLPVGAAARRFGPEWVFVGATVAAAATSALLGVTTVVFALIGLRLVYGVGAVGLRVSAQMLVNAGRLVHGNLGYYALDGQSMLHAWSRRPGEGPWRGLVHCT